MLWLACEEQVATGPRIWTLDLRGPMATQAVCNAAQCSEPQRQAWRCWLGHLTRKIVSEMTYTVSSVTSNPTIPYLCVTDMWFWSGEVEETGCNTDNHWQTTWHHRLHGTRSVHRWQRVQNGQIWRLQFWHSAVGTLVGKDTVWKWYIYSVSKEPDRYN